MLTTGAGLVQIMVARQVKANLAEELRRQAAEWDPIDKTTASLLEYEYRRTHLEPIRNYLLGDRPSVLRKPWTFFPTISFTAHDSGLSPEALRMDYTTAYTVPFWIEAIVPGDHFDSDDEDEQVFQEGVVERRTQRTADAIVQCLLRDRTLGGVATESTLNLRVRQTPSFQIQGKEKDQHGQSCIFSLARIDAQVDVYAGLPGVDQTVSALLPAGLGLST